jgi:hypothetical protein
MDKQALLDRKDQPVAPRDQLDQQDPKDLLDLRDPKDLKARLVLLPTIESLLLAFRQHLTNQ